MAPSFFSKTLAQCPLPQRYVMTFMTSWALFNCAAMRTTVHVALLDFGQQGNTTVFPNSTCPDSKGFFNSTHKDKTEFHWSPRTQDYISSSFYLGYFLTHLPAGVLSDLFGAKHVLNAGIFGSALLSLVTPIIVTSSKGNWGVLLFLRIIQGLFLGVVYPAVAAILGQWIPAYQKSLIATIAFSGAELGSAAVLLSSQDSWTRIFYIYGAVGMVWCPLWQLFCYSSPETHPGISEKESEFLTTQLEGHVVYKKKKLKQMPWRAIYTSPHIWGLVGAELGHTWLYFIIGAEMPKYMRDVLKLSIKGTKLLLTCSFFLMWMLSIMCGHLCDFFISRNYMSVISVRILFTTIGYSGSALFFLAAASGGCNKVVFISCSVIALCLMSAYNPATKVNVLDLSPNFAGLVMGLVDGCGISIAIASPLIILFTTPHQTLWQWHNAFCVSFFVSLFSNLIFVSYASGDEQPWNLKVPETRPEMTENKEESVF